MEESEHHFRLEPADVRNSRNSRELVKMAPRELDLVQDGRYYHISIDDRGGFSIAEPRPQRRWLGSLLLLLAGITVIAGATLLISDYIHLKLASRPMPAVLAGRAEAPPPAVLGSTQNGKADALIAPLPATYDAPKPTLDFANAPTVTSDKAVTVPASEATTANAATASASPAPVAVPTGKRQIPLSRGFGTVEEIPDGSQKYLVRPDGQ